MKTHFLILTSFWLLIGCNTKTDFISKELRNTSKFIITDCISKELRNTSKFIIDEADLLSQNEEQLLKEKILEVSENNCVEIIIYILPYVNEDLFQFSEQLFKKISLSSKYDIESILFLVSVKDKKIRIHTGQDYSSIPDLIAKQIIDCLIKPNFKICAYYNGFELSINTIVSIIEEGHSSELFDCRENKPVNRENSRNDIPTGVSSSCFCSDALSGGNLYDPTSSQISKCRKMYICWDNAYTDCLMGTEHVWTTCEMR